MKENKELLFRLAAAKEIRVAAAAQAAVLSEPDSVFTLKGRK